MNDDLRWQFVLLLRALHGVLKKKGKKRRSSRRQHKRAKRSRKKSRHLRLIKQARTAPCTDCGLFYGADSMEFDHRDSHEKLFGISDGVNRTRRALLAEIEKCDIVCCPCHEKREQARGRQHGGGVRPCPNVAKRGLIAPRAVG